VGESRLRMTETGEYGGKHAVQRRSGGSWSFTGIASESDMKTCMHILLEG
jgi:hypothetical protein